MSTAQLPRFPGLSLDFALLLCRVEDTQHDQRRIIRNCVHDDVRKPGDDPFTCIGRSAWTTCEWKITQHFSSFPNPVEHGARCAWVALANVFVNAFEMCPPAP